MPTELLACDGCGAQRQGDHGETLDKLRERLAKVGWLSDKARDRDACPYCIGAGRVVAARG